MVRNPSTSATLPALGTQLSGAGDAPALVVTLLFHPDTSRIGESCVLDLAHRPSGLSLGRSQPDFSFRLRPDAGPPRPLGDPFISRDALHFRAVGDGLQLSKPSGSSRCRLPDGELSTARLLSAEQLDRGIPLLLGHGIVVLLRRCRLYRGAPVLAAELDMVGDSDLMAALADQVKQLGVAGVDVLIRGPTGSGKERVAAALHACSQRANRPFVAVNMAAIPPELAPAALFGAARGAYTGAGSARPGFFQQAAGGTLFLDEVGDTPAAVQAQLLRALQEREVQVVGGAVQSVELRVISATELELEGGPGGFRAALRHRLGAGEIVVPALARHPEDIGSLALHFYRLSAQGNEGSAKLPAAGDGGAAVARWAELVHLLAAYTWPGSVRELANLMARIAVASVGSLQVPEPILAQLRSSTALHEIAKPVAGHSPEPVVAASQFSDAELDAALAAGNFEVARVARELGISRQALYRRIEASRQLRLAGDVPLQELLKALDDCRGDLRATAESLRVSQTSLKSRLRAAGIQAESAAPD